ncbi:MAG: tetratricopeptide repeat protein [Ardenticatenaceae bacterium]|nr:tetratricopeptide repeat protein [Ardenticatenaceae bacterium]MCB8947981.1 tetratricopeptide repeat protein [Ardenticatenaceae bacterium]
MTISLLGGVTIALDNTAVTNFASRKADALLVYLACNPRPHPRETLATLFWPDNDQTRALANLSVILTSLRKQLDNYLVAERHTVSVNHEMPVVLDVAQFEKAIAQAQPHDGKISRIVAAQLQTAVSLYKGDFLAGFNLRGVPEFEAWVLLEQERLRQMMLAALADLITFHQQRGQFSEGIQYAQQLLALDPLQEETHRQLMQLYALDNQRPAALAQYEQCAAILDEELGVEPDEETVALYESIRDDTVTRRQGDKGASQQTATLSPGHLVTKSPLHNLPTATTTFIGRKDELAQIESWLRQADGRLLTIIGPGGMGKTRLAQEAARQQIGEFADGVWYVSLVAFGDLNGLATAVAESIGLELSGKETLPDQLLKQLQPLEALLVLDNLEHLLNDPLRSFLSQLCLTAPELCLITTSRERLRLQAEHLLELEGLPFPVVGDPLSVSGDPSTDHRLPLTDNRSRFTNYPAVQLFANRVQQVRPEFDVGRWEIVVAKLCQLTGGLPLALELAATWTRVLTVAEIVAEIERGLDALSTTLHDVPERHRSLRAVIESSWQMLAAEDQVLFRQLAVFRSGFTRSAAQQVANARLPQLMSLVDRSFLRLDGDQRFRRHPLLLQFAQEQLAAHFDERAQTEAKHGRFFADFIQVQEALLKGEAAPQSLAEMSADLENIRAAWRWALQQDDAEWLSQMIGGVGRFFGDRSRFLEGMALFRDSLSQVATWSETAVREQITARLQVELGYFLYQNGLYDEAEAILKEADTITQKHNMARVRLICLKSLGDVIHDRGNWAEARPYLQEALRLCDEAEGGDADLKIVLLNTLGNVEVGVGNYDAARIYFEEGLILAHQLKNSLRLAILHNNIAIIANREEKYKEAIEQYQLAHDGFQANDHQWGIAATSHNIGMVYASMEQYDEALPYIQDGYAVHEKIGHRRGMVGGLSVLGTIYRKQGQRKKARRYYNDSLQLAREVGVDWSAVATVVDVAELEMSYGRMREAAQLLIFALQQTALEATTQKRAQELLEELKVELPAVVLQEAETAVANLTLDDIIIQLTKARPL